MAKTDYYELLGIKKGSDADEIKKAYRRQAMKYHPDKNPGDKAAEEKFKEVCAAYEVLKDPQKKAAYDQFGHSAFENGTGGGRAGSSGFNAGGFDFNFGAGAGGFSDIFSDIFSDFMGGGRTGARARERDNRGQDLRYDAAVSLEEAYSGIAKTISYRRQGRCPKCGGAGGQEKRVCPKCHGSGVVSLRQGFFMSEQACPECQGLGFVIKNPCGECGGTGVKLETKTLSVKIPAGVETGGRLKLAGEGEAGLLGGGFGDLYIYVGVKPHNVFARDGRDLQLELPVGIAEAALGGTVEVPVIEGGKVEVKVPNGIQNGERLRIKGRGMPGLGGHGRGDMFLDIKVEVPKSLSARQAELLREFDAESRKNGGGKSFFGRVKDWL
ncbi:MAG: molecular chaperone DnaJ [Rickettsiales bacterium]|jgi:molecular chaperone DnaJ|nr:molecular chaperone DnaJ [Rickettsiales bacterium]